MHCIEYKVFTSARTNHCVDVVPRRWHSVRRDGPVHGLQFSEGIISLLRKGSGTNMETQICLAAFR
jgi:hypothetical protein